MKRKVWVKRWRQNRDRYGHVRLLGWNHVSCFGHTLNIGVNRILKNANCKDVTHKIKFIQNSIAHSWVLKKELTSVQIRLGLPEHRILSVCETRWWSLVYLMKIIVEQHVALVSLFTETGKK